MTYMTEADDAGNAADAPLSTVGGPGRFWQTLDDGRIECCLCPRYCRLNDGQRAFCFVRQNIGGHMVLTTYGRTSGFCVDPIEKKPLNHFYPGTAVLSFGTAGCNLGCRFCQNWDISKAREVDTLSDFASPDRIAEAAVAAGCRSVAFTYNDPVIFAEFAIDCAKACRERGVKTVAVTAGYITKEARSEFFEWMDAANVDLKAFTEQFYHKLCFAHLEPVKDTLRFLKHETHVWFEVTTLLIPGQNDSPDEIARLCDWFLQDLGPDVPLHFTAFHPDFKMTDIPATLPETCQRARRQALAAGLHHVYTGNIADRNGQSTFCTVCGTRLIQRDGYDIGAVELRGNRCRFCDSLLAGCFDDVPPLAHWGRRRKRLRIV